MKNITLGQYFPGNTLIHRLDPRVKLVSVILLMVALFTARGVWGFALGSIYTICTVLFSRVKIRLLLRGLRPVIGLLLFTTILNLFFTPGEPIFTVWRISISREGLTFTGLLSARIIMLVISTSILTYTTTPLALTDGLEKLMKPLAKLRLPVSEVALMMSMALTFIPTLLQETQKIMNAQRARGANFSTGSPLRRARALLPVLIPLFLNAFRRADDLAIAMESRCYTGGAGRTRMRQLRFTLTDFFALMVAIALLGGVIFLRIWGTS